MDDGTDDCFNTAIQLWVDGDYESAYREIKHLYIIKHSRALNFVGRMFEFGFAPFEEDAEKAFCLYKMSNNAGSIHGKTNLGRAHFNGVGTAKNKSKGVALWREAAEAEKPLPYAQSMLAWALWNGYGTDENKKEALKFYYKAKNTDIDAMCELGMIYLYEPSQENEFEGLKLLEEAAAIGNERATSFMTAYMDVKELCNKLKLNSSNRPKSDVIASLHKCMQYNITLTDEERNRNVLEYVMYNAKNPQKLKIKHLSNFLLLLAHVIYLREEAPYDEQNICMIVELLEAGITEGIESNADRLYEMTRGKKGHEHPALIVYDKYHALSGSDSHTFSHASQVAKNCRELFPEIGSKNDIFCNALSCADAVALADIIAYSFSAIRVNDLEQWASDNVKDLIAFRTELAINYIQLDGNKSNVSYEQLVDFVSSKFSKSALNNCIKFYNEFDSTEGKETS